jgi:ligand-binding sensor domain-containing protein
MDWRNRLVTQMVDNRMSSGASRLRTRVRYLFAITILVSAVRGYCQEPPVELTQYSDTAWRTQQRSFNGTVLSVTGTKDGYLWVGTSAGLLRFDGVRFSDGQQPGTSDAALVRIQSLLGAKGGSL